MHAQSLWVLLQTADNIGPELLIFVRRAAHSHDLRREPNQPIPVGQGEEQVAVQDSHPDASCASVRVRVAVYWAESEKINSACRPRGRGHSGLDTAWQVQ